MFSDIPEEYQREFFEKLAEAAAKITNANLDPQQLKKLKNETALKGIVGLETADEILNFYNLYKVCRDKGYDCRPSISGATAGFIVNRALTVMNKSLKLYSVDLMTVGLGEVSSGVGLAIGGGSIIVGSTGFGISVWSGKKKETLAKKAALSHAYLEQHGGYKEGFRKWIGSIFSKKETGRSGEQLLRYDVKFFDKNDAENVTDQDLCDKEEREQLFVEEFTHGNESGIEPMKKEKVVQLFKDLTQNTESNNNENGTENLTQNTEIKEAEKFKTDITKVLQEKFEFSLSRTAGMEENRRKWGETYQETSKCLGYISGIGGLIGNETMQKIGIVGQAFADTIYHGATIVGLFGTMEGIMASFVNPALGIAMGLATIYGALRKRKKGNDNKVFFTVFKCISDQIKELHIDMRQQFGAVHEHLNVMHRSLFDTTLNCFEELSLQISAMDEHIFKHVEVLHNNMGQLRQIILGRCDRIELQIQVFGLRDLRICQYKAENWIDTPSLYSESDFVKIVDELTFWSTESNRTIYNGLYNLYNLMIEQREERLLPDSSLPLLQELPTNNLLGYLAFYARDKLKIPELKNVDPKEMIAPTIWCSSVSALVDLLSKTIELRNRFVLYKNVNFIRKKEKQNKKIFDNIQPTIAFVNALQKGGHVLFEKLFAQHEENIKDIAGILMEQESLVLGEERIKPRFKLDSQQERKRHESSERIINQLFQSHAFTKLCSDPQIGKIAPGGARVWKHDGRVADHNRHYGYSASQSRNQVIQVHNIISETKAEDLMRNLLLRSYAGQSDAKEISRRAIALIEHNEDEEEILHPLLMGATAHSGDVILPILNLIPVQAILNNEILRAYLRSNPIIRKNLNQFMLAERLGIGHVFFIYIFPNIEIAHPTNHYQNNPNYLNHRYTDFEKAELHVIYKCEYNFDLTIPILSIPIRKELNGVEEVAEMANLKRFIAQSNKIRLLLEFEFFRGSPASSTCGALERHDPNQIIQKFEHILLSLSLLTWAQETTIDEEQGIIYHPVEDNNLQQLMKLHILDLRRNTSRKFIAKEGLYLRYKKALTSLEHSRMLLLKYAEVVGLQRGLVIRLIGKREIRSIVESYKNEGPIAVFKVILSNCNRMKGNILQLFITSNEDVQRNRFFNATVQKINLLLAELYALTSEFPINQWLFQSPQETVAATLESPQEAELTDEDIRQPIEQPGSFFSSLSGFFFSSQHDSGELSRYRENKGDGSEATHISNSPRNR